jgi:peptidyl-prolyl cis-trans isomerase B (cyclophilin B)
MSRKNPFKGAIVLTVIAAVTVGLYFILDPYFEKTQEKKDSAVLLWGGLGRDEIYELRIKNPSNEIHIKKLADRVDTWSVSEVESSISFDADAGSVNGIISTVLAARKESSLPNLQAPDVGLLPPTYELDIVYGDQKRTLHLGSDTPVDYLVYAKWSDSEEIFLTSRSLRFGIDKRLSELRNKKVFDFRLADYKEIKLEAPRGIFASFQTLHFTKDDVGQWFAEGKKKIPVLADELNNFLQSLNKLSVRDFVSEDPKERDSLGFRRPALTFTLTPQDPAQKTQVWKLATQEKVEDGSKRTVYYTAHDENASTYEVPATFRDAFDVSLIKFRDTKITDFAGTAISEIQIQTPRLSIHLVQQNETWKFKSEDGLVDAKEDRVREILSKVAQLRATEFFDEATPRTLGLDKPLRVVEIALKQGQERKTLFFGKKTEDATYIVNTEGLSSPATVKLDVETLFPEDLNAYRVEAPKTPASEAPSASQKGKKVKLETTVNSPKDVRKLPAPIVKPNHRYTAHMKLSNGKELELEFHPEKAPYTVSNFLHLARNNFYNDVVFHRVIRDFVIQGGDPTGTGTGGPGYKFDNEDNDLKHVRGALSMAHAGRNTNGSQFFIVLQPQPHLDGLHTVFAKVTKGAEILDEVPQGTKMVSVEVFEEAL